MKKILSTILFTMSFIATAHAETSISLTPTQSQAVEKLTDASVQIFNIGDMFKSLMDKDSKEGMLKAGNPKQACMNEKFATSQGYRQYQHERAIKYVIAKTPQQVQQDLNLLTPQVVKNTHEMFDMVIKDKLNSSAEKISSTTDKRMNEIMSDPAVSMSLIQLTTDTNYQDLRNFLNMDKKNMQNSMMMYMLWSMQQCDAKLSELRAKGEK